jgi:hypothetical protein
MTKKEEAKRRAEVRRQQREAKETLIDFCTDYVQHGRYGWYLTDYAKRLVASGIHPLIALHNDLIEATKERVA